MTKMKLMLNAVAVLAVCLILSSLAQAQATRTWVSGVGDDANPCSRTAPCKTFAGAISKTADGGEISVLDPGGFGAVTITKGITLDGDGTLAGILNSGSTGIIVNAPGTARVTIRNISINGAGTGAGGGLNGIRFLAGGELHVDKCTIQGFTGNGIDVALGTSGQVHIKDTTISKGLGTAIKLTTTSGLVFAMINNVSIEGVPVGVDANNNTRVTVRNSTVTNANTGLVSQFSAGSSELAIENSTVVYGSIGVKAGNGAVQVRLSSTLITGNTTGVQISGGTVTSFGNNRINGNTADVAGGALANIGQQ